MAKVKRNKCIHIYGSRNDMIYLEIKRNYIYEQKKEKKRIITNNIQLKIRK